MIGLRGGAIGKNLSSGVNAVYKSQKVDLINKKDFLPLNNIKMLINNKGSKCKCDPIDREFRICGDFCKFLAPIE